MNYPFFSDAVWAGVILAVGSEFTEPGSKAFLGCLLPAMGMGAIHLFFCIRSVLDALKVVSGRSTTTLIIVCGVMGMFLMVAFPVNFILTRTNGINLVSEATVWAILEGGTKVVFAAMQALFAGKYSKLACLDAAIVNKKARYAAESANKAKQVFLRYVLHEARVPLNTIVLGLQDMEATALENNPVIVPADPSDDLSQAALITAMRLSANTISKLLNDFLSLEKIESGKV
jgi:signal transduction histidine kinase